MPIDQPPNLFVFCKRARMRVSEGRYDDALEIYNDVIAAEPGYAIAWADRGTLLCLMQRHPDALESLRNAVALGFSDPSAYNVMGTILAKLDMPQAALEAFAKAVELDPTYPFTYYNRFATGDKPSMGAAARKDLEACTRLNSDDRVQEIVRRRMAALG